MMMRTYRVDELTLGRNTGQHDGGSIVAVLIGRLTRVITQILSRDVAHEKRVSLAAALLGY